MGLCRAEDRVFDGLAGARGFLFLNRLQLIEALDEEQVGHLLDDLHGVGDAAAPEGVPDLVDLTLEGTGDQAVTKAWRSSGARYAEPFLTNALQLPVCGFLAWV